MNMHLENAIGEIAKADALLSVMDDSIMEDADSKTQYLFMTVWDTVRKAAEELDRLAEDKHIVDVIYAANDVRRRNRKDQGHEADT